MKCLILLGSPRKRGNTMQLVEVFEKEMEALGHDCETVMLYGMHIEGCIACRHCQNIYDGFACFKDDDMQEIAAKVLESDLIVLASPIYSWYCTPAMKAVMDRLVYGMNKYYGTEKGPALMKGKELAIISTCGYEPEKGADLWEEGVKRYCVHSGMEYKGMCVERHMSYTQQFMTAEKEARTKEFARSM